MINRGMLVRYVGLSKTVGIVLDRNKYGSIHVRWLTDKSLIKIAKQKLRFIKKRTNKVILDYVKTNPIILKKIMNCEPKELQELTEADRLSLSNHL